MLEIGEIIDEKYKILSIVGQGGMSTVYKAVNIRVGNYWAIKEFTQKVLLENEVLVLGKLKHKGLPLITDVVKLDKQWYLVEEFIDGICLSDIVNMQDPVIEDIIIDWAIQLCNILRYLHSQMPRPIIYQDMKPSNVIVGHDGIVKLVDFGISTSKQEENDKSGLGTRGYAAPEQYKETEGKIDVRTDIYGLGAILYHLVTGFKLKGALAEDSIALRKAKGSKELKKVILQSIQPNPENRYQDIISLMSDLKGLNELSLETKGNKKGFLIRNPLV